MELDEIGVIDTKHRRVPYTVELTEALEAGDISPAEYVRLRANLVGQGDIFQSLIIPLFKQIILRLGNFVSGTKTGRVQ